jgi:hypothetical protein
MVDSNILYAPIRNVTNESKTVHPKKIAINHTVLKIYTVMKIFSDQPHNCKNFPSCIGCGEPGVQEKVGSDGGNK